MTEWLNAAAVINDVLIYYAVPADSGNNQCTSFNDLYF
jgi:hypothetical protein